MPLDAMSVDVEEWFHICGVPCAHADPATWCEAPSRVETGSEALLRMLDRNGARATFFFVGRIAELKPGLVRRVVNAGHEIGCHGHLHRLVFEQTPEQFEADLVDALRVLRDLSGQPVFSYRAPGFSITPECLWAYPILRRHGVELDSSLVPARRAHGGAPGFPRTPFALRTEHGLVRCVPMSVMRLGGRLVQFSGGGFLRLLPSAVVRRGVGQARRDGRPVTLYIHPHDVDPGAPRLTLPPVRRFKRYVGVSRCEGKLDSLLRGMRVGSLSDCAESVRRWPEYVISGRGLAPACGARLAAGSAGADSDGNSIVPVVVTLAGARGRLYSPPMHEPNALQAAHRS